MQTLFTRLISVGAFSLFASQALAAPINATLHKDPNCGCCVEYAHYLEDNGFNVKMIDHANMTPVKQRFRHRTSRQLPYGRNRRLCGGRSCTGRGNQQDAHRAAQDQRPGATWYAHELTGHGTGEKRQLASAGIGCSR